MLQSHCIDSFTNHNTPNSSIPATRLEVASTLQFESHAEKTCVMVVQNPIPLNQVTANTATKTIPKLVSKTLKILTHKKNCRTQATDHGLRVIAKTYTTRRYAVATRARYRRSVEISITYVQARPFRCIISGFETGNVAGGRSSS